MRWMYQVRCDTVYFTKTQTKSKQFWKKLSLVFEALSKALLTLETTAHAHKTHFQNADTTIITKVTRKIR
jgi:hypothetical protein